MQDRMKMRNDRARLPGAFLDHDMNEFSEDDPIQRQLRMDRMRMKHGEDDGAAYDDQDMDGALDFEDVKGKLSLWLQKPEVIKWIRKIFDNFLRYFKDEFGQHVYDHRINEMCLNNKQSLEVTFIHLSQKNPTLAIWLAEEPSLVLPILNDVALELVTEVYPEYQKIHKDVYVRVRDLPVEDKLRDLR